MKILIFKLLVLLGFAAVSVLEDLRKKRIPNLLIIIGLFAGTGLNAAEYGWKGLGNSFLGILWTFMLLWFLFWLHALGGGDVKLCCVCGAFLGPGPVLDLLIRSLICGAVLSLFRMIRKGIFRERLQILAGYLKQCMCEKRILPYIPNGAEKGQICFSPAIFAGLVWTVFISGGADSCLRRW